MRPSFSASALLVVVVSVAIPGVLADQADHHAFISGTSDVPPEGSVSIQLNHTIFRWATLWYSARVSVGPAIEAFMVDEENHDAFLAGADYGVLPGTSSGPTMDASGLAASLPTGIYFLVLRNPSSPTAVVKWEVFLEPRLSGDPAPAASAAPWYASSWVLILAGSGGSAATGLAVVWWRRHGRRT